MLGMKNQNQVKLRPVQNELRTLIRSEIMEYIEQRDSRDFVGFSNEDNELISFLLAEYPDLNVLWEKK